MLLFEIELTGYPLESIFTSQVYVIMRVILQFVGREAELSMLNTLCSEVSQGQGKTVLITGEPGIGKTALLNQIKHYAESFNVLSGICFQRAGPLDPFIQILDESQKKELLGSHDFVSLDTMFLIKKNGLLLSHISKSESDIDKDILSGMLTAVQDFVEDSFGDKTGCGGLGKLEYRDIVIIIEHGKEHYLAGILKGKDQEIIRRDMAELIHSLEEDYIELLSSWEGRVSDMGPLKAIINEFMERRYRVLQDATTQDFQREKFKIFERLRAIISRMADDSPVMLTLDNIQWMDPISFEALLYLARSFHHSRVMIATSGSPVNFSKEQKDGIQGLVESQILHEMELKPLDLDDMMKIALEIVPNRPELDELVNKIYQNNGGNPLFLEEYLFNLDIGLGANEKMAIPQSIMELVDDRLKYLNKKELMLAEQLAILGEHSNISVLTKCLSEWDQETFSNCLDKLVSMKILKVDDQDDIGFSNTVYRDVTYDYIGKRWIPLLHEKSGLALEEVYKSNLDDVVYDLANHFSESHDVNKALYYSLEAGDKAFSFFAHQDALNYYQNALQKLDQFPHGRTSEKAMFHEKIGDVLSPSGGFLEAIESFEKASNLYSLERDIGRIYFKTASSWFRKGEYANAESMLEKVLDINPDSTRNIIVRTHNLRGMVNASKGSYKEAISLLEKGRDIAIKHGDRFGEIQAVIQTGDVYHRMREYDKAFEVLSAGIAIAEELEYNDMIAFGYNSLGSISKDSHKLDEALKYYGKCKDIVQKTGDVGRTAAVTLNIGLVYLKNGQWDEAIKYLNEGLEIQERTGNIQGMANAYNNLGIIYDERGEWDKSRELHMKSLGLKETMGDRYGMATSNNELGWINMRIGEVKESEVHFLKSIELLDEIENWKAKTYPVGALGELYLKTGEIDRAQDQFKKQLDIATKSENNYEIANAKRRLAHLLILNNELEIAETNLNESEALAKDIDDPFLDSEILRIRGVHFKESGDFEAAILALNKSMAGFEKLKTPLEIGKTLLEIGMVHSARGDIASARQELEKSLKIFRDLGANMEIKQTEEILTGLA